MAFSINYDGIEDGDFAEAMLGAIDKYDVHLDIEWNDPEVKDPRRAYGELVEVANGFIIVKADDGNEIRVTVGSVLNVHIIDEIGWEQAADAPDCSRCGASNAGSRTPPHLCDVCDPTLRTEN